jgi:imidazolonepropionase-like amidohydrolase
LADGDALAIEDVTLFPSPDAEPVEHCTVVARGGRIVAAESGARPPAGATTISGEGRFLTAGFWNCHVHFTEPKWRRAARAPPEILEASLREMLTSRGFTTAIDTGSDPRATFPLARRLASGEVRGPFVVTAGSGIYPPKGLPYYVRDSIPFWVRPWIPQPSRPASAVRQVEREVRRGAGIVKLFTGSYVARGRVVTMPEPVARAAVDAAHRHHRLVFSHPSNLEGTRVALRSGVDVLAHPPDSTDGVDDTLLRELVARRMGMIPTLKMFGTTVTKSREYLEPIYDVLRRFRAFGGQLLFGTDVGYMQDYSTDDEFTALGETGLDWRAVLATMTTWPSERFGVAPDQGTVVVGCRADLVLLDADPRSGLGAFSRVRATIRSGRVQFQRS